MSFLTEPLRRTEPGNLDIDRLCLNYATPSTPRRRYCDAVLRPLPHLAALNLKDHDQGSTVLSPCSFNHCDQHPSPSMSFSPAASEQPTAKAPPFHLLIAFLPEPGLRAMVSHCREPELLTTPTTSPEFPHHR